MKSLSEILEKINIESLLEESRSDECNDHIRCFSPDDRTLCSVCGGIGWYVHEGNPKQCDNYRADFDQKMQEALMNRAGIIEYAEKTFNTFRVDIADGQIKYTRHDRNKLVSACQSAKRFASKPDGWLVYEGRYGSGKTHLALAIARKIIQNLGMSVKFITSSDLLDGLRSTFSGKGNSKSFDQLLSELENVHVLILDDYGSESPTEWAREKLFQLLNYRHANRLPTVITTNIPLQKMPPRIRSRMMESVVVEYVLMDVPDYRMAMSKVPQRVFSVSKRNKKMTFKTFKTDRDEQAAYVKEVAQRWLENKRDRPPLLAIVGGYGVGKTHLLYAMCDCLEREKEDVLFIPARDMSDNLHSGLSNRDLLEYVKEYTEVSYLLVDNLDSDTVSGWSKKRVLEILIERIDQGMPTVISMTRTAGNLDKRLEVRMRDEKICYECVLKLESE